MINSVTSISLFSFADADIMGIDLISISSDLPCTDGLNFVFHQRVHLHHPDRVVMNLDVSPRYLKFY